MKNPLSKKIIAGFTLIELIVVMGIFSVISLMILANHSRFNSSVLLGSLAYNIALSVRQAQVYGVSVQTFNSGFQVGYGIHITPGTSYVLFADTGNGSGGPADKRYEGTGTSPDSIVQTYSVGQGHSIKQFCGVLSDGSQQCSDDAVNPIDHLDIVFFRPEPDANITSNNVGFYSGAKIVVASPSGETRYVTVASTGQISVSVTAPINQPNQCIPSNICGGSNIVNSCTGAIVQTCQYGCSGGTCNACVASGALSCSGNNVVDSCGVTVQTCTVNQTCTSGACVNNSCTPTYSCNDLIHWVDSCTGATVKTCVNGCGANYPTCLSSGGGGGSCFAPDTPVLMADGSTKAISTVGIGDSIVGEDASGARHTNTVTKLFVHQGDFATLKVNGSLIVTPNHPIKTKRGWIEAGQLVVGDVLTGTTGEVPVVSIENAPSLPTVYNLEVEPDHTYFAGGVLVHNKIQN